MLIDLTGGVSLKKECLLPAPLVTRCPRDPVAPVAVSCCLFFCLSSFPQVFRIPVTRATGAELGGLSEFLRPSQWALCRGPSVNTHPQSCQGGLVACSG